MASRMLLYLMKKTCNHDPELWLCLSYTLYRQGRPGTSQAGSPPARASSHRIVVKEECHELEGLCHTGTIGTAREPALPGGDDFRNLVGLWHRRERRRCT